MEDETLKWNERRLWRVLLLMAAMSLMGMGCADDPVGPGGNTDTAGTDGGSDGTTGDTRVGGDAGDCSATAGQDADNDGIANGFEDKNLNCIVDPGETDWQNPDSDGDGVSDGDEDLNRNGIVDPGEFDPNLTDSDGNGVPDGQETSKLAVCTPDLLTSVTVTAAAFADTSLALPPEYSSAPQQAAQGATFSNGGEVFGYVVKTTASSTNVAVESGQNIGKVAQGGNRPTNRATQEFKTWFNDQLAARDAIRNELLFAYGAGSANSGVATKDPAVLRDEILSAISGQTVAGGETGTPCDAIQVNQVAELRADGSLITSGIVSCESNVDADEALSFQFEDFFGSTVIAPNTFAPDAFNCEDFSATAGGGAVDFLWVIDNSGSMADEQGNVAATAQTFLETLVSSGVDWRLAVTTTETYLIANGTSAGGNFTHRNLTTGSSFGPDELLDLNLTNGSIVDNSYGLRGDGFLASTDDAADVRTKFIEYITFDAGCARTTLAPENSNICGSGLESGLQSGVWTLQQTAALNGTDNPRHYLRPEATRIVVWISDEEDQKLKPDLEFTPYPADSPIRTGSTQSLIQQYKEVQAIGAAIVGDLGDANGGICSQLDSGGAAVDGAQYGQAYIEVATALGGVFGSVCNPDLQATIDAIIELAVGTVSNYELSDSPIASSIRVALDGEVIPRSTTQGWNYNPVTNSIVFFGIRLEEGQSLAVAYKKWLRSGG